MVEDVKEAGQTRRDVGRQGEEEEEEVAVVPTAIRLFTQGQWW